MLLFTNPSTEGRLLNLIAELDEIVDPSLLKQIEFNIRKSFEYDVAFVNLDGAIITEGKPYKSRPFLCKSCNFIARYPNGFLQCQRSDKEACDIVAKSRAPLLYKCRGGFSNFAIPVKVQEEVIGCLFGGQVLVLEPKDELQRERFNSFCREFGILMRLKHGEVIRGDFFYNCERIAPQRIREIAKESGIGGFETVEFSHVYKLDFSLRGGRIIDADRFMRDFSSLASNAKTVSSLAQAILDLRKEEGTQHVQPSQLPEPIDIPSHYTISFKINIPRKEMSQQLRKMKMLELEVLDSTISPEARKILAETVNKASKDELNPEIKKIILEVLGRKRRSFLGRW